MSSHPAAILPSKGARFEKVTRPTPTPGPNDVMIEVSAIALNPIDYYQRDMGFPPLAQYPSVLGSDIGGTIKAVGSSVTTSFLTPGTRVSAFAPCFYSKGAPDYGAFQSLVLVPAANVTPIPHGTSFNEASILPMAVVTTWSGLYSIDIARDTAFKPADKQGFLVWGAASSVGTAAVQVAKSMGYVVYATASEKHHEYLKGLGASKLFDYKGEDVVGSIVEAAKADGVTVSAGYDTAGQAESCAEILKQLKGEVVGRVAAAVPLKENAPKVEGVEMKFVEAPKDDEARTEHFQFVFNVWLKAMLENGKFVPAPRIQVVGKGLEALNDGLDELKKGVSGTKLVIEV